MRVKIWAGLGRSGDQMLTPTGARARRRGCKILGLVGRNGSQTHRGCVYSMLCIVAISVLRSWVSLLHVFSWFQSLPLRTTILSTSNLEGCGESTQ